MQRNISIILDEAFSYALRKAIRSMFPNAFGITKSSPVVKGRHVSQTVHCSGRNVRMQTVEGRLVPVEDRSVPDRIFQIDVELMDHSEMRQRLEGLKIIRALIKNYRAIKKQDFDFSNAGDRILLFGLNGSGKTSVLEACMLALGSRLDYREPPEQDYLIQLTIEDSQGNPYVILKTPINHVLTDATGAQLATTEFDVRRMVESAELFFFSSWRAPKRLGGINLRVKGVRRSVVLKDSETLPVIKTYLVNKFVYNRVQGSIFPDDKADVLKRLDEAWQMFYPEENGVFFVDRRQTGKVVDPVADLRFDVYLRRDKDSVPVSIDDLSAGELEIFCMLGVLLIQSPPYSIAFIDEPELHLNRVWHRTIMDALARVSPKTQFIVTTHSFEVMDSFLSRQVFQLGSKQRIGEVLA